MEVEESEFDGINIDNDMERCRLNGLKQTRESWGFSGELRTGTFGYELSLRPLQTPHFYSHKGQKIVL